MPLNNAMSAVSKGQLSQSAWLERSLLAAELDITEDLNEAASEFARENEKIDSAIQNAINILDSFDSEEFSAEEAAQATEDSKADIGWGSQIRSYVLDDSRVKDLRTGVETSNTQAVLDGSIDQFIEASLKSGL